MKLDTEFYKLPFTFDVERLMQEVNLFDESEWREHPSKFDGNDAMILVSARGEINDDMHGPMRPTDKLERCPYIRQIMASFETVIGRSRLMRLAEESEVNEHYDVNYYWHHRVRVHIPIATDERIRFHCNGKSVHMGAGEAWVFDNWRMHKVENPTDTTRIHLVFDTTGSAKFWEMVGRSERPVDKQSKARNEPVHLAYDPDAPKAFPTEQFNVMAVMPPAEVDALMKEFVDDLPPAKKAADKKAVADLERIANAFRREWRCTWSLHGDRQSGWTRYGRLIEQATADARALGTDLAVVSNGQPAIGVLGAWLRAALNVSGIQQRIAPAATRQGMNGRTVFQSPVFIVGAPRSGTTFLFETLANSRGLWTIGGEGHHLIEGIPKLTPAERDWHSNRLTAADADRESARKLMKTVMDELRDCEGRLFSDLAAGQRPPSIRLLEKTPKNSLRIPFLQAIFPGARFVYLHREPRQNIASIMEAWESGKFVTYPDLPGWEGLPWSLALPPGWRDLNGRPLEDIAAFQWRTINTYILDDLAEVSPSNRYMLRYEELCEYPEYHVERLCGFLGIPYGRRMKALFQGDLPLSRYTVTPPDPDKWKKHEERIERVMPSVRDLAGTLAKL